MAGKYLTYSPVATLISCMEEAKADKVLIVTDENVERLVLPKLVQSEKIAHCPRIVLPAGETEKNLDNVVKIWDALEKNKATRKSLVLNIGGGVITDMGGFAAATFKRGIRTINFPTTLLAAVDAATGGKTGINFNGLKNEIGAFHQPWKVVISTLPFSTLDHEEILSGYAEMVKTALISDKELYIHLLGIDKILNDNNRLGDAVEKCVEIKEEVVRLDPKEEGLRKILNFGHTAGHAFESLCIEKNRPITHGKAVAHGMLVALVLSHILLKFPSTEVHYYSNFLKDYYGPALISCEEIEEAMERMNNDKKNGTYGEPAFTLLKELGEPEINCRPSKEEIRESLEIYLDMAR